MRPRFDTLFDSMASPRQSPRRESPRVSPRRAASASSFSSHRYRSEVEDFYEPRCTCLGSLRLAGATLFAICAATYLVLHGADEQEHFDFIVVGGGATGSVVAGRLGQAGYTVLLLEAGGPTQQSLGGTQAVAGKWTIFDVPLSWVQVLSDHRWSKQFQWDVPADPPPAIARGLGGCGIHNAMLYMRGRPEDFATWGAGWSWSDVLPFYKRSITNNQHDEHGTDGPVSVTSVPTDNISRAFVDAARTAGLRANDDFNGGSRYGAGYYQFMIRNGVRDSAAAAFLGTKLRPKTVTVRTHALVSRVLFGADKRAHGVEIVRGKNPTNTAPKTIVYADREVILSAGAVNTPKLLLLSGIGERAQLENLGIDVVHHHPSVGRGLADGVYAIMQWVSRGGDFVRCRLDAYGRRQDDTSYCREQLRRYASGDPASVFASPGMSAGAFLRSPYAREKEEPDVQLTIHPWDKYGRAWSASYGGIASMEIANNHPRSRGRIALRSNRFDDPPIFEGPYLRDVNDSLALLWALRQVREIARTPPLASMLQAELIPGAQAQSDAELFDQVQCGPRQFRQLGRPACDRSELVVNHLAGTCRLGNPKERTSCVDLELRVLGVSGLRVADASVMPRPPSGNTHATCMMIGERAADFIIRDARAPRRPPVGQDSVNGPER